MRSVFAAFCAVILLAFAATPATAQAWPKGPVRLIVPAAPGGPTDLLARAIAQKLSEDLGQSFIVDNRPGAAAQVGSAMVARAASDGYTLGVGTLATLALAPFLARTPVYDPRRDFTPVAMLTQLPQLMATPAQLPGGFEAFIDFARRHRDAMNYSTNGVGSTGHILGEMVLRKFGLQAAHVPYGGDVPILNALMGEQVQLGILAIPAAAEFIKAGRINALAMTGARRSPILPDVPTIVELGYPDLVSTSWFCIVAPAGTPADVVELANRAINAALATPQVLQVFKAAGLEPEPMRTTATQSFVAAEQDKWSAAIKTLDIHVD